MLLGRIREQIMEDLQSANKWHYVLQPVGAFLFIWFAFVVMGHVSHTQVLSVVGMASLASSALVVFTAPTVETCRYGNILGGYAIGILCGIIFRYLVVTWIAWYATDPEGAKWILELMVGLSVGACIAVMAYCRMLHAPAVSMNCGLVLMAWDFETIVVVCGLTTTLVTIKWLLKSHIKSL